MQILVFDFDFDSPVGGPGAASPPDPPPPPPKRGAVCDKDLHSSQPFHARLNMTADEHNMLLPNEFIYENGTYMKMGEYLNLR